MDKDGVSIHPQTSQSRRLSSTRLWNSKRCPATVSIVPLKMGEPDGRYSDRIEITYLTSWIVDNSFIRVFACRPPPQPQSNTARSVPHPENIVFVLRILLPLRYLRRNARCDVHVAVLALIVTTNSFLVAIAGEPTLTSRPSGLIFSRER